MITWLPWSAEAFARAAREGKPVLLSITAAWCQACHEMDRTTYADPGVAALVRDRFVAVRVDTDRRPDINERYNLGGWPTTAFLTAAGEIIAGGTFVAADHMGAVLGRVADTYATWAADHAGILAAEHTEHAGILAAEHADHAGILAAEHADHAGILAAEHADHAGIFAAEHTEHAGILAAEHADHAGILAAEHADHAGILAAEHAEHTVNVAAEHAEHAVNLAAEHADHTVNLAAEHAEHAEHADDAEVRELIEGVFASFDEEYGGFGVEPKFPHTAPIHLALELFRDSGDERWRTIVERTLDAMADGGLWDAAAGGFFRYSTRRDWRRPHTEKLLETNADLLRVYAEAALVLGRQVDRDRCAAIAAFITGVLRSEAGGYRGSDADGMLYMDGNAKAAGALVGAATVLDDSTLAQEALASFERVILLCYKPGAGLAHYSDGVARVRGLLGDQLHTVGALLDAYDISGLEPYKMMAEELTHVAVRELWDEVDGGFFNRAGRDADVGLLRTRRKPFVANAEAASLLARLERTSGDPEFRARAEGALRAAAGQLAGQGPLVAHYLLGARQLSAR